MAANDEIKRPIALATIVQSISNTSRIAELAIVMLRTNATQLFDRNQTTDDIQQRVHWAD
jgi:hypothetical protein